MIDIAKYFRILFLSVRISRARLKLFTEDHIGKLAANNPGGVFTALLTAITNAYNSFFGDMADVATIEAALEGKTVAMNDAKTAMLDFIRIGEKNIAFVYRLTPARYEEFYPQGLTEYDDADLPNFDLLLARLANKFTAYAADFDPDFVNEFTELKGTYNVNRTSQISKKGELSGERNAVATTKSAVALQLTKNVMTIGLHFVGDEAKAEVYFDQAIIDAAFSGSDTLVAAEIDNGETQNAFDNTSAPETQYKMKTITTDKTVLVAFMPNATAPVPPEVGTVVTNVEATYTAGDLGYSSVNKFMNVTNASGETVSYRIERV